MSITSSPLKTRLDDYYQQIKAIILNRQNPITGLLPASTAITAHGDYTDAWVRDNVYSILAVWGLGLAYRKLDNNHRRTYFLQQSVVKLMRGLLFCMMRQVHKVERFKQTQSLLDALHAKYNTQTGDIVVGDDQWGHLQLDATSLFILMLAQMTESGLKIIYTYDEVNFVQNLVYYIGRTYRTPDYGLWERGNKINRGNPELNASSVGMALAALEAINGLDLFGVYGSQHSAIHVLPDEIARTRITLESLLPRESSSKETDAALLSVIGFPAFAVNNSELVERTRKKIIDKLQGRYGCKRFLRDGHQTVLEDPHRLHYEPWELQQFEHIECEWPLFFTYLLLDGLFQGNTQQVKEYQENLEFLIVERDGLRLLPEVYYVPAESVEAERLSPKSQKRLPNENVPLVWAQSLYLLGQMLSEGLIAVGDIDPLGRHLNIGNSQLPVVQIALLAESEELRNQLATYGIATQTLAQIQPLQVRTANELADIYSQIGSNAKLGLTGRPRRRLRSLTTSKVFRIQGETIVFLPSFADTQQFYLNFDYHFLTSQIKSELAYIQSNWNSLGRPTLSLLITQTMFDTGSEALLELIKELQYGECNGVAVRLGRLHQLMLTASIESIDFLESFEFADSPVEEAAHSQEYLTYNPDRNQHLTPTEELTIECLCNLELLLQRLRSSENIYEQIELLQAIQRLQGLEFDTGLGYPDNTVKVVDLINEVYFKAGTPNQIKISSSVEQWEEVQSQIDWGVVRRAAGLLNKVDLNLLDAVTEILIRQKEIMVGKSYSEDSLIIRPIPETEILEKINTFCREDIRDRVLTQEILLYLGLLIKSEPQLFKGLLTLRVGYLILLITSELASELQLTQDEAYERLMQLSPSKIKNRLRQALADYNALHQVVFQQEALRVNQQLEDIEWLVIAETDESEPPVGGWLRKRQRDGAFNRVPSDFYPSVWRLLTHCKGLVIGDKLERRNRLESNLILPEMTPGEKNFALLVEHLLNKIPTAETRQVNIEALMALAALGDRNPKLQIEDYIVLDVVIGHGVRLSWLDPFLQEIFASGIKPDSDPAASYDQHKIAAWRTFYDSSPFVCASYVIRSLQFLTELGMS